VRLVFEHHWNGEPIKLDGTTQYINAARNILTFDNLEYIISDLTIAGIRIEHPDVFYINTDTANSVILLTYQIPTGNHSGISFTFGLDSIKNKTNRYPNLPPQMVWPVPMGGGYHYMMIDGKWRDSPDQIRETGTVNLHLGALEYKEFRPIELEGEIVGIDTIVHNFHNYFTVSVPKNFTVNQHEITTIEPIIMDVERWMNALTVWDFNVMGGSIMSRQAAMDSLARNGRFVFR